MRDAGERATKMPGKVVETLFDETRFARVEEVEKPVMGLGWR
jgi:hypothetical protein